jgi:hypothetical protein
MEALVGNIELMRTVDRFFACFWQRYIFEEQMFFEYQ